MLLTKKPNYKMTYLGKDSQDVMEGTQGLDDIACGRVLDSPLTC